MPLAFISFGDPVEPTTTNGMRKDANNNDAAEVTQTVVVTDNQDSSDWRSGRKQNKL
jgi:hypothetical protein